MRTAIDLTGREFGNLVVVERHGGANGKATWLCACDCGGTKIAKSIYLTRGVTTNCGCRTAELQAKMVPPSRLRHGHTASRSVTPEYRTWAAMKRRCLNPKTKEYPDYGGRGITVCQRWVASFEAFLADMGPKPKGLTIERIDNMAGYSPDNCCWATQSQQNSNQRPRRKTLSARLAAVRARAAATPQITGVDSEE